MRVSSFILLLSMFFIQVSGCYNSNIEIPDTKTVIIPNTWKSLINIKKPDISIGHLAVIVYVDGRCLSCIKDIEKWEKVIIKNPQINFIFFTDAFDTSLLASYITRNDFSASFFYDKEEAFWKLNDISIRKKINNFLILDSMIIYKGDFLYFPSKKIRKYLEL